jgi:N6-L-threonylcarbamoyladenine synthase
MKIKILAIETSFDDTAVAVLEDRKVLSSVVSSSTDLHKKWGGVVPDISRRAHIENIELVYKEALKRSRLSISEIDYIAVTYGPGLAIDLEVGLDFAKSLAKKHSKTLVPVNHMEGHLLSSFLLNSKGKGLIENIEKENLFPAIGVLVSGNHTELILVSDFGKYVKLGQTLDDAAGEAFDKVGRMLDLGFPGGPIVTEFAKKGEKGKICFSIPMKTSGDLNFSYSGLKTACLYKSRELKEEYCKDSEWVYDFCSGFVDAVAESIVLKLEKALCENKNVKSVFAGGGVLMNEYIARKIAMKTKEFGSNFFLPTKKFRTDNAGMIGVAGYFNILNGNILSSDIDRDPRLELGAST